MKMRVLAIDDEERWRGNFKAWIPRDLAICDTAGTTAEAVTFLRHFRYDVVLLDLSMDVNDPANRANRPIQEYLATRPDGTLCIVVSATAEKTEVRDLAYRLNASDVIFKAEIDPDVLVERLRPALQTSRLSQSQLIADARNKMARDRVKDAKILYALSPKGGAGGMKTIFDALCLAIAPVVVHDDRKQLEIMDDCVVGLVWSRQLGQPVSIVLCNERITEEAALGSLSNWLGYEARGQEVLKRATLGVRLLCFMEPSVSDVHFALPALAGGSV